MSLRKVLLTIFSLAMVCALSACGLSSGNPVSTTSSSYSLNIKVIPPNSGSVVVSNENPDKKYSGGTKVNITAIPNTGYEFVRWEGDVTPALSLTPEPGIEDSNPLEVTLNRNMNIFAICRLYQPAAGLSDLEIIKGASQKIVVSAQGGDFNKLSDALNSIKDASEKKRYVVLVVGNIDDTSELWAKSYVDVIGFGADITIASDADKVHGLMVSNVRGATWRNVTIRRTGTIPGYAHTARIFSGTDRTFRLENCRFINNVVSTQDGNNGMVIFNWASPTLIDCVSQAGPGNYTYGIIILGNASPILFQTRGIGGSGSYNCHGIVSCEASHATLINCVGQQGLGGYNSYGLAIIDQASPVIVGSVGTYQTLPNNWVYTAVNNGRFRPFEDKPYQLFDAYIVVNEAASAGTTLNLGVTPGGSEIASKVPIDTLAYKYFQFKRVQLKANEWLYATPSSNIKDSSIKIFFSVVANFENRHGMYLRTEGYPVISNSNFFSCGSSPALMIGSDVISSTNWRFNNCYFETLDSLNQNAVKATVPVTITEDHMNDCTFIGAVSNVSLIQGKP